MCRSYSGSKVVTRNGLSVVTTIFSIVELFHHITNVSGVVLQYWNNMIISIVNHEWFRRVHVAYCRTHNRI